MGAEDLGVQAAPADRTDIDDADDEDEDVHVVLNDHDTKRRCGIAFYLGIEKPDDLGADGARQDTPEEIRRQQSTADIVAIDEGTESVLQQIRFQMDVAEMADTTWRQTGANQQDYFNFGMEEKQFKEFIMKQIRTRLEARQRRKIGTVGGL